MDVRVIVVLFIVIPEVEELVHILIIFGIWLVFEVLCNLLGVSKNTLVTGHNGVFVVEVRIGGLGNVLGDKADEDVFQGRTLSLQLKQPPRIGNDELGKLLPEVLIFRRENPQEVPVADGWQARLNMRNAIEG